MSRGSKPSWDSRMIALAQHWSQYSSCLRRQVGAVIYHPTTHAIVSIGFNETPIGAVDCGDGGCEPCAGNESTRLRIDCLCIAPEQRVLMADLTWKAIEEVQVGEKLLSFGETTHSKAYRFSPCITEVVSKCSRIAPQVFEYFLDDGTSIKLTPDHRVLTVPFPCYMDGASGAKVWKEVDQSLGIARFCYPWNVDRSWEAGWLAGFFDGEGCLTYTRKHNAARSLMIAASQAVGPTLDRSLEYLHKLSFNETIASTANTHGAGKHPKDVKIVRINGGFRERLRFLGQIRPQRLLDKWERDRDLYLGGRLHTKMHRIVDKKPLGRKRVFDLGTTSGGIIVEGLCIHNCVHAEQNALCFAARFGSATEECWIATHSIAPCLSCQKLLIQAGITRIISPEGETNL